MTRLSNEELTQISERAEKATRGEWTFVPIVDSLEYFIAGENGQEAVASEIFMLNDADFIAHAREDIPKLLAEIERLQERSGDASRILELDTEIIERQEAEIERLQAERDELYSIALWCARRFPSKYYKNYMYDMIDKATGTESERV